MPEEKSTFEENKEDLNKDTTLKNPKEINKKFETNAKIKAK